MHHKELLSDYLRKRHSVTKLVVHLVFTTKYRRKLFDGFMIEQLRSGRAPILPVAQVVQRLKR